MKKLINKSLRTLSQNYSKAPFFNDIYPIIESVYLSGINNLARFSSLSVTKISEYLELNTQFSFSSELDFDIQETNRTQRLIKINKGIESHTYINSLGGKELYSREDFAKYGINLYFLKGNLPSYDQGIEEFVPALSIIDILMFNQKQDVLEMLKSYVLI